MPQPQALWVTYGCSGCAGLAAGCASAAGICHSVAGPSAKQHFLGAGRGEAPPLLPFGGLGLVGAAFMLSAALGLLLLTAVADAGAGVDWACTGPASAAST